MPPAPLQDMSLPGNHHIYAAVLYAVYAILHRCPRCNILNTDTGSSSQNRCFLNLGIAKIGLVLLCTYYMLEHGLHHCPVMHCHVLYDLH